MEYWDTRMFVEKAWGFLKDETKTFFREELFRDPFDDVPRNGARIAQTTLQAMFKSCPPLSPSAGDLKMEFTFEAEDSVEKGWKTACDSDWGEGYSTCKLERSPDGRAAIFSGDLSTRVPRDGRIKRSGYCNMASIIKRRSYGRKKDLFWWRYTDLVLWVRGDGRTYRVREDTSAQYV